MHRRALLAHRQSRCNYQGLIPLSNVPKITFNDGLTSVILFIANVANPKYPCITKPARMHLISEMPEPAAYFARFFTR
jgi:hypothetical protein